jgi:hypothetical protein
MRGFVWKTTEKGQLNFLEKSCEKSKKSRTAEKLLHELLGD